MTNISQSSSLLVVLLVVGPASAFPQLPAPTALSDFAECAHHTCLWVPWSTHKVFQRQDLSYTVEVYGKDEDQGDFVLRRANQVVLRTPLKDLSGSVSVVWSDDDHHFAVTWSDGGAIGGFHVRVFQIQGNVVKELSAGQKAWDVFKSRHWCEARGDNIQAYAWLPASRQLILVLSVYPTGDCGADLGHTEAYVVDAVTGEIQQHWDAKRLNAYIRSHPE